MNSIYFSSVLKSEYGEDLESLMFFNAQQGRVSDGIIESIERFGTPKIVVEGQFLRIAVGSLPSVQTLFAFEHENGTEKLVGVLVYFRSDVENIVVLHVAAKEDYCMFGGQSDQMLLFKLITKLREIASRIKGVRSLTVMYQKGVVRQIPIQS